MRKSIIKIIKENPQMQPQDVYSKWAEASGEKLSFQDAADIEKAIERVQRSGSELIRHI